MRRVLVTGGTRGIGRAIAEQFAQNGDEVIITGTGPNPRIDGFEYIRADFSNKYSVKNFLDELEGVQIDILINNAGINIIKPIDEVNDDDYDKIMDVNLKVPYMLCKAAARSIKSRGYSHGRIVNIASIFGVVSKEKRSLYSASKSALIGLTKSLAIELGPDEILVNCVSPGFTDTELTRKSLTEKEMEELESQVPLGRFADVEEIARVVFFLCHDNSYITGQNIVVDGGFTAK